MGNSYPESKVQKPMKAIVNTAPGTLEFRDWPTPEPAAGQVRIRTAACGICATDLEMIAGWERTNCPAIPGHEWAGIVDRVGQGVDAALIGKHCVAENVLADGGEVGFEHPGGYGEFLLTEAKNLYVLPPEMPLTTAVLIEPLAVCVRGLKRLRLTDRGKTLIFGDGPIGLIMLMLLKHEGVEELCLVGGRPSRLELGRELGAAQTLNYHEAGSDLTAAITRTFGPAFPNVIEASGSAAAMQAGLALAAPTGKVLVLGDYGKAKADFPWNLALHRELEIIGSNASADAWPQAVELATSRALPLERLISRRFPASACTEAVQLARSARDMVKIVLEW